jgi:hypothetical protein
MALHKLLVDDFIDTTYSLMAIHCTLEDYRVAYLLNQYLQIKLKRNPQDLDFKYVAASYPIYEWEDKGTCDDCGDELVFKEIEYDGGNCFPCMKGNREDE